MLTTDRNHPGLKKGADESPVPQQDVYLVLSDEELAKGFIKPVRNAYRHIGPPGPQYPLRDLTDEEREEYKAYRYVKYEEYPKEHPGSVVGRFWTQVQLDRVGKCGQVTTMGRRLAETYARDPWFYGGTYCAVCHMHRPLEEFVWQDGESMAPSKWPAEEHQRIANLRKETGDVRQRT